MDDDVIRGRRLSDVESILMNLPDIPIYDDNGLIPLDPIIERSVQLDVITYRVTAYYKTHYEEIHEANDGIDFILFMIEKAMAFMIDTGTSTEDVSVHSAAEVQTLRRIVHLTETSNKCLLMAANELINIKERKAQMKKIEDEISEVAKKVVEHNEIRPPIDYMDIGKKIGVSSTKGMELHEAMNNAYEEWKENDNER